MAKQPNEGLCHLCGTHGKLSFEHVPPKAAFNDQQVLEADINRLIGSKDLLEDLSNPRGGRPSQRGAGKSTLCRSCNNDTGAWYAASYVEFVKNVFPLCTQVPQGVTAIFECTLRPLDVYKQILVMFCSACPPTFAEKHPRLVRYLLNRYSRDADDQRVFLSLYDPKHSLASRQAGLTVKMDGDTGLTHIFAEIAYPPFNIVMAASGGAPDQRLFEITWFKNYDYREQATVRLALDNLAVTTYFPADYRTVDELKAQIGKPKEDD